MDSTFILTFSVGYQHPDWHLHIISRLRSVSLAWLPSRPPRWAPCRVSLSVLANVLAHAPSEIDRPINMLIENPPPIPWDHRARCEAICSVHLLQIPVDSNYGRQQDLLLTTSRASAYAGPRGICSSWSCRLDMDSMYGPQYASSCWPIKALLLSVSRGVIAYQPGY